MGKLTKKDNRSAYLQIYEDALPDIMETNVKLQRKALEVIEKKIDDVSAAQAATIYGILHDKCHMIMSSRTEQNTQFNMYFGDTVSSDEASGLMERVLNRMKSGDGETADAEVEEVEVVD